MNSGLNSCMALGGLFGKPEYVAAFSLMNPFGGTFNVHAVTHEREHLRCFLDQWERGEFLDLCGVHECSLGKDQHSVRLLHQNRSLGIHVFSADLSDLPEKRVLLTGFRLTRVSPDFCHTFRREQDAMAYLQRWRARMEQQEQGADNPDGRPRADAWRERPAPSRPGPAGAARP